MNPAARNFLFELLDTPSPTGFEVGGQRLWAAWARQFSDRVESDTYGTAWATLEGRGRSAGKPAAPTVMLEAHADEIGFIVKHITSEGWLHIDRIGGADVATARGRRLRILGDRGPVPGVIGNTAIHIRDRTNGEKVPEVHQLFVDVGASSDKEVGKLGLRVGHPAVYSDTAQALGKHHIVGRALDNRVGGFIIAQALAKLHKAKSRPGATVYAVNAVQEEIGGYGAKMVTHRLKPDVAIVLDVTHATDTPGIEKAKHGEITLGGGPSITHGACNHPAVIARLMEVARDNRITIQHESSSRHSGTDTDQIYHVGEGIPSALVSLPLRYMHSVVEMADTRDIDEAVRLLTAFVMSLAPGDNFGVKL